MAHDKTGGGDAADLPGAPRRGAPRYDVRRTVEVRCDRWSDFLTLYTGNVSRTGFLVRIADPPRAGTRVDVRVEAPDGTPVMVTGVIARVDDAQQEESWETWELDHAVVDGGGAGVGVQIQDEAVGALLIANAPIGPKVPLPREGTAWQLTDVTGPEDRARRSIVDFGESIDDGPPPGSMPTPKEHAGEGATAASIGEPRSCHVAIDFGTSTSKGAVIHDRGVVIFEDDEVAGADRASIPSIVAFHQDGSTAVGRVARELLAVEPARVIASVKRLLGLSYDDPRAAGVLGSLACPSLRGPNGAILFEVDGRQITVPEVASLILGRMKELAEAWAGQPLGGAVLTHPLDFDDTALRELRLAAEMAGITIMAMVPEPVAAAIGSGAIAYPLSVVAVYDLGGGTFDASVVGIEPRRFDVMGCSGDRWLGGDDIDEAIARYAAREFQTAAGIDLFGKREPWQRLLFASEDAKRWLSTLEEADIIVPGIGMGPGGPRTLLVPATRPILARAATGVLECTMEVMEQALAQAGIGPQRVNQVVLTGGSTLMPAVRETVTNFFGQEPVAGIHPEYSVVVGAAVHASALAAGDRILSAASLTERLPEAAPTGRAIGIAVAGGLTEPVIFPSESPPITARRLFSTHKHGQRACCFEIVEGDRPVTAENHRLGRVVLDGLPPMPAGAVDLDVYFELSATGTLCVTAKDRGTGRSAKKVFEIGNDL